MLIFAHSPGDQNIHGLSAGRFSHMYWFFRCSPVEIQLASDIHPNPLLCILSVRLALCILSDKFYQSERQFLGIIGTCELIERADT